MVESKQAIIFWLNLLLFSVCIKSHTVKVCNVVAADGKSVELFGGTYHSPFERPSPIGGILLKGPGDATYTRYDFTSWEYDDTGINNEFPPSCSDPGVSCDCSLCPTYTYNGINHWQKVTVTNLVDGHYEVDISRDTAVEWPWCSDYWNFDVEGSLACNDYLYFNDGVARTQAEAQAECEAIGSDLATITTQEQLDCALLAVGDGPSPWVGLYSSRDPLFFQYVDGSACPLPENGKYSGQCTGKFGWLVDGEPICLKDGGSKCVRLLNSDNGGKMNNDKDCEDTLTAYLCNNPAASAQSDVFSIDNILSENENMNKKLFGIGGNTLLMINIGVAFLVFIFSVYQIYYCCLRKKENPKNEKMVETMDIENK